MEDKDKHINQMPDSNYPEPSVPAGNAWANMNDMLNQEIPISESTVPGKNILIKSLKFILPSIVLATAGIVFWNYGSDYNNVSTIGKTESSKIVPVKKYNEIDIKIREKGFEKNNNLKSDSLNQKENFDLDITTNGVGTTETLNILDEKKSHSVDDLSESNSKITKQKNSKAQFNNVKSASNDALVSAVLRDVNLAKNSAKSKLKTGSRDKNNSNKETDKEYNSLNNNQLENIDKSNKKKNSLKLIGKHVTDKQNIFRSNSGNQLLENEKTLLADLNNTSKEPSEKQTNIGLLKAKFSWQESKLKQKFESISVKNLPEKALVLEQKIKKQNNLLKDIHVGLQWNANLPMKGYDHYFTGANNRSNQFYTLIIPGLWIEKKLKNGNGIMLKLNPYSQYFGNNKQITSSTTSSSDSLRITKIRNSTNLVKVSGTSGGLQYNQRVRDKLSIGIGANIYWQNRALLNNIVSDSAKIIMSDSLYSVKETSIEGKYLNYYFVTTNLEVLYTWRKFQLGAGIVVPVTSMTGISDKKIRPVSGQLVFRWRLK